MWILSEIFRLMDALFFLFLLLLLWFDLAEGVDSGGAGRGGARSGCEL